MRKSVKTHLITLFITSGIFLVGVFLGMNFEGTKTSYVESHYNDLKRIVSNTELEFYFIQTLGSNMPCDYFINESFKISQEADLLANKLRDYESNKGFDDPNWVGLKQDYTISLIKNWIFVEKIRRECNANYTTVLYFYDTGCSFACEDLSFFLSYYKGKDRGLMVYALQSDLDMRIMSLLNGAYNVTSIPAIVVDGGDKFVNLSSSEDVRQALCTSQNQLSFC